MRTLLLGAATVALMAAPGVGNAATNAVVGIDYNNIDFGSGGPNVDLYGIDGAFNHDFSNGWQLQMDGFTGRASEGNCCVSSNYAAVHLGTRTNNYSVAGFVGLQDLAPFSGVNGGIEGQLFFSQAMLEGSVAYADYGDIDLSDTNAQVDGSFFFTPNFSVNGSVAYNDISESGSSGHWWVYGVSGEYRFANSPASVSLGYRQLEESGEHVDFWSIGVSLDLGTGSLQERNKSGPSWNGARSQYDNFGEPFGSIFFVSDRRLKRDIALLTTLTDGMRIYSFRYNWSDKVYVGVMAQDLLLNAKWRHAAALQANGFYAVNYAALGLRMATMAEWRNHGLAAVLCGQERDARLAA
jgi:hypothetical protein